MIETVNELFNRIEWRILLTLTTYLILLFVIGYLAYFDYFQKELPYKDQIAIDSEIYQKATTIQDAEAKTAFIKEIAKLGEELREDKKRQGEMALQIFNIVVGALLSFLTVIYTKYFDQKKLSQTEQTAGIQIGNP